MARAAAKKNPAGRKPAAPRKSTPARPAPKARGKRAPVGGILGDIMGLRTGLRVSFEAMLARDPGEERLLAFVSLACLAGFMSGLPTAIDLAATMPGENALIGLVAGRFVAVVIFGSLFLYGLAAVSHWFCYWGFHGRGTYKGARLALFWALFLAIPLGLLHALAVWALPFAGLDAAIPLLRAALFLFWLWLWITFLAVAEGLPRGGAFLLILAIGACLTGLVWLLSALG